MPYDKDLAEQRARYGDGLIRKAPEQISRQEQYEGEAAARVEEVKKLRAEEHAKIMAAEVSIMILSFAYKVHADHRLKNARKAEIEKRAAELAEQRRLAQEEARAYHEQLAREEAEEIAAKQQRSEAIKDRKRRKENGEVLDGEDMKPKKRKTAGGGGAGKKKGRNVRSKSEISDSSEEDEESVDGDNIGNGNGDGSNSMSRSQSGGGDAGEEVDPEQVRKDTIRKIREERKKVSRHRILDRGFG